MNRDSAPSRMGREEIVTGWALTAFGVGWLLFLTVGRWLIQLAYNQRLPWDWINRRFAGRSIHPVEVYQSEANSLFINLSVGCLVAACAAIFVKHRLWPAWRGEESRSSGISFSLFVALVGLAILNRFMQDDAFISFRYAWNFVHGHGLTWNVGEAPIQGYTNPLWTLLMTFPIWMEWDPVRFAKAAGLVCFALNLWLTYRLAFFLTKSATTANLTLLLLGTNYTFSAYATGGLETQSHSMLLTLLTYLVLVRDGNVGWSLRSLLGISLVAAVAMLTRLDSALVLTVLYVYLLYQMFRSEIPIVEKLKQACALLLPASVVGAIFVCWTLGYYGDIVPNTFYVKASSGTSIELGLRYLLRFSIVYGWLPFLLVVLACFPRLKRQSREHLLLGAIVFIWLLYVVKVGGCFMEFRMLVPILPLASILIMAALANLCAFRLQCALLAGIMIFSLVHACNLQGAGGVQSIAGLNAIQRRWELLGRKLGGLSSADEGGITIASRAAGAIPYFSRLRTVDMHGLNDRSVALHGLPNGNRPGHQRMASGEYLASAGVNLVLELNSIHQRKNGELLPMQRSEFVMLKDSASGAFPKRLQVVEIPFGENLVVMALYLTPHETIDQKIKELNWRTVEVVE